MAMGTSYQSIPPQPDKGLPLESDSCKTPSSAFASRDQLTTINKTSWLILIFSVLLSSSIIAFTFRGAPNTSPASIRQNPDDVLQRFLGVRGDTNSNASSVFYAGPQSWNARPRKKPTDWGQRDWSTKIKDGKSFYEYYPEIEIRLGNDDAETVPGGVVAVFNDKVIRNDLGSDAVQTYRPPGFDEMEGLHLAQVRPVPDGVTRGHILPQSLGGSGGHWKNLVPLWSGVNRVVQNYFEREVSTKLKEFTNVGGMEGWVRYEVRPHYSPNVLYPHSIEMCVGYFQSYEAAKSRTSKSNTGLARRVNVALCNWIHVIIANSPYTAIVREDKSYDFNFFRL